jgi:hypothetical protein
LSSGFATINTGIRFCNGWRIRPPNKPMRQTGLRPAADRQDGVAPDEWVAYEYAKTRRHYDRFDLGDQTEIEYFNGPHTINGVGTFAFLREHLDFAKE